MQLFIGVHRSWDANSFPEGLAWPPSDRVVSFYSKLFIGAYATEKLWRENISRRCFDTGMYINAFLDEPNLPEKIFIVLGFHFESFKAMDWKINSFRHIRRFRIEAVFFPGQPSAFINQEGAEKLRKECEENVSIFHRGTPDPESFFTIVEIPVVK